MTKSQEGAAIVVIENEMAKKRGWGEWYRSSWLRYTAIGFVAMCMYLPDQVTTVASKHLTVALNVPAANTGVYTTKLYATKTLVNFVGSLLSVGVQMLFTNHISTISCVCMVLMGLVRIALFISFYVSNAAVGFYIMFIVHAFIRGMFESTFYPLGADDMSTISLSFKTSKVILWAIQVFMDFVIADQATWMVTSHLILMMVVTVVATFGWIVHLKFKDAPPGESSAKEEAEKAEGEGKSVVVDKAEGAADASEKAKAAEGMGQCPAVTPTAESKPAEVKPAETPKPLKVMKTTETLKTEATMKSEKKDTEQATPAERSGSQSVDSKTEENKEEKKEDTSEQVPSAFKAFLMRLVGMRPAKPKMEELCQNGCCNLSKELVVKREMPMRQVIRRVISPFFMCVCGWPLKNFFIPGLLPYTMMDRKLSHPINLTRMFFTFIVTFVIHFMKLNIESMGMPWPKAPRSWHMTWLFLIPPFACMPFIYIALHYPQGAIFQGLHNNQVNVGIISVLISGCTTIVDTVGYIGVAACSKDDQGERGKNSIRFIAINSFLMQLIASFTYRLSAGYQIIRRKYVDDISNSAPTDDMSWIAVLWFWTSSMFSQAGYDFVHEFDGNIREFAGDGKPLSSSAS
ncbi:MYOSIN LIGHT CHAIN KINASE domain containing protein [Babesia ovata]|uniref:MYOSIN LIGHT CHAIN KINASE domain containing protein n=1 Tax=Babesia ovata TaxID=189622 RepID=A0A2H6K746_9APIC|nr:MYOSIN LIGHT CHAIN KINASE domain containing protein [Babesia ovata]GBE58811.1 MYOSIN LIGHT CHAIN KINASE domain containing protein [Babesia ovata]